MLFISYIVRSEHAQQIMSKLPIFTNNQLQQLVREPILQDKMVHHVKFTTYAYYLIEMVMGPRDGLGLRKATLGQQDEAAAGLDMASLHRASVVATSNIAFPRTQLLQLIHQVGSSKDTFFLKSFLYCFRECTFFPHEFKVLTN